MDKKAKNIMTKARVYLLKNNPFYGKLAMDLEFVESKQFDTMAVDGQRIFYNPDFVHKITFLEVVGVIAHEVLHVVFKHHLRRNDRDAFYWNVAGDYVINYILIDEGFTLPEGGLIDYSYKGSTTEKVYKEVYKENDKQDANTDGGDSTSDNTSDSGDDDRQSLADKMFGEVIDAVIEEVEGVSNEEQIEKLEQEINAKVIDATQVSKNMGKGGDAFKSIMDMVRHQSVSWDEVLGNLILDKTSSDDYNFNNPNRRYVHQDMYLPSIEKKPSPKGVIALDISGSVQKEDMAFMQDAINNIIPVANFEELTILYCDDCIRKYDTYSQGEEVELDYICGGGTAYEPVFKYIDKQLDNDIAFLVYLTDGYCWDSFSEPDYPVIWATTGTSRYFKFGEVVDVE
jgi:predicted metal-dependent peptidase